jgi:hypothetical protein
MSYMARHAQSAISRGRPSETQGKKRQKRASRLALHDPSAGLHNDFQLTQVNPSQVISSQGQCKLMRARIVFPAMVPQAPPQKRKEDQDCHALSISLHPSPSET